MTNKYVGFLTVSCPDGTEEICLVKSKKIHKLEGFIEKAQNHLQIIIKSLMGIYGKDVLLDVSYRGDLANEMLFALVPEEEHSQVKWTKT